MKKEEIVPILHSEIKLFFKSCFCRYLSDTTSGGVGAAGGWGVGLRKIMQAAPTPPKLVLKINTAPPPTDQTLC